jgi:hypothetical protein
VIHDGAPQHFDFIVKKFLDNMYPIQWIGRGDLILIQSVFVSGDI